MKCLCYIINNCFTYDWFKDIWIPLFGAIAIPLLIWFLTRYYGADKAEERKELKGLRDNLNLLISMICENIILLLKYRNITLNIIMDYEVINTNINTSKVFHALLYHDCLKNIDCTKYATCIQYSENFVGNLIEIQNLCYQLDSLNLFRNNSLNSIINCESKEYRENRLRNFIKEQANFFQYSLNLIDLCIIKSKNILDEVQSIERLKKLKLDRISCDDPSFFEKIKQEYDERNKNQ